MSDVTVDRSPPCALIGLGIVAAFCVAIYIAFAIGRSIRHSRKFASSVKRHDAPFFAWASPAGHLRRRNVGKKTGPKKRAGGRRRAAGDTATEEAAASGRPLGRLPGTSNRAQRWPTRAGVQDEDGATASRFAELLGNRAVLLPPFRLFSLRRLAAFPAVSNFAARQLALHFMGKRVGFSEPNGASLGGKGAGYIHTCTRIGLGL